MRTGLGSDDDEDDHKQPYNDSNSSNYKHAMRAAVNRNAYMHAIPPPNTTFPLQLTASLQEDETRLLWTKGLTACSNSLAAVSSFSAKAASVGCDESDMTLAFVCCSCGNGRKEDRKEVIAKAHRLLSWWQGGVCPAIRSGERGAEGAEASRSPLIMG